MKNLFLLIAVGVFLNVNLFAQVKTPEDSAVKSLGFELKSTDATEEFQFITAEGVENFVAKVNAYGKFGYKIEKVTRIPSYFNENLKQIKLAAVIRLDNGNKYVYDWSSSFESPEFVSRSGDGFKPVKIIPFSQNCDYEDDRYDKSQSEKTAGYVIDALQTENGNIFLLEQKNGSNQKQNYQIINAGFGIGKQPTEEILSEVNTAAKTGFNPSRFFFSKTAGLNQTISLLYEENNAGLPNAEYVFVRDNTGFKKKVNSLAKQGFVLAASGEILALNVALMRKDSNSSAPLSYKWLNASDKKTFAKDLAELSQKGAYYRTINWEAYGCKTGFIENRLIFENNPTTGNRYEYKTLKMTEDSYNRRKEKFVPNVMLPFEISVQNFKKTMSEGYIIRDLFYEDGVNVLFERPLK